VDRDTQTALIDRVLAHMEHGAGLQPVHEVETEWPVDYYYDPDRYAREVEMVRRHPFVAAHASQLAEPGDFVTTTVCERPIVVCRTQEGELRAFLNVCRHRGSELVGEPCGAKLRKIVCPYHAWTYELDGRLSHVPDRERSFPALDVRDRGLVGLAAEERHGLVWVIPDPAGTAAVGDPFVERFLGPELDAELADYRIGEYAVYRQDAWDAEFNWKCGTESFLENYHFSTLHRASTYPIFLNNMGFCHRLGTHFRAVAPKRSIQELREADREKWDLRPNATVMYLLFPSTCLFVEKDHFNLLHVAPAGLNRSKATRTHLVRRLSPRLVEYWDANIEVFMSAVREDFDVCESMQRGFRSGANAEVLFGRNEFGCHEYRECIEQALAAPAGAGAAGNGHQQPA
jgi:phenylpropionate dioxygenase-like ring-hydroxylating dioxygenase large terminal subunit